MTGRQIAKFLNPWMARREQRQRQVAELRQRDGDTCRRCRRPMRFDLPPGHEKGPSVERMAAVSAGEPDSIAELFLCHCRCNAAGADHTDQVTERIRRKNEAALLPRARQAGRKRA